MKVARLGSSGTLVLEEVPAPAAGPGELVVELAACGVCGTDLEKLRGNYRTAGVLGHEPVGRVVAVGEGVRELRSGDRVFAHHHIPCLACEVCRRGDTTFCPTYVRTNLDPGGFAERFRVSAEHVRQGAIFRLDEAVGWGAGALIEPAGCALTALRKVSPPAGGTVLVLGLGPVGLLYARLARRLGASWVGGSEVSERRRAAARAGGIDAAVDPREANALADTVRAATGGQGVDLAVAATGHPAVVRTAFELVRRGGTVNLFGLPEANGRLDVDLQQLYLRGVRLVPSYATTEPDLRDVHAWIADGSLKVDDLVSHHLPLGQVEEAFRLAGRPEEAVKVVVTGSAFAG